MRRLALTLLLALSAAGLAACGGSATPSPTNVAPPSASTPSQAASAGAGGAAACAVAPAGATAATTVTIKEFKFSPQTVEAKVGDAITWKNDDNAPHTATMDDGSCDTDTIAAGTSATLVFTAAGTYKYHCKIHAAMKDVTVEVK